MSIEKGGTSNKPSSTWNFFKRAIATAAVLAALSWEAKEVKTIDANQNQTEIVEWANVWATNEAIANFSVEETTQSNNYYNYIKNIQPSVDKYFPEYSSYFRNVLSKFNEYGTGEKYIINKWINEDLNTYNEYWKLTSEKDKTATALIVFDYLEWNSKFIKDTKINHKNSDWTEDTKIEAATWILKWIKREYDRFFRDRDKFENELKRISESLKSWVNQQNTSEIIKHAEGIMKRYKEYIIDAWMIKESQIVQDWIWWYIKVLNIAWKQPSEIGKIYINEYYKIRR